MDDIALLLKYSIHTRTELFDFQFSFSQTVPPTIPAGGDLKSLVHRSFLNVDMDKDGFIEYYEFDTLIIVADKDSKYNEWTTV